MEIDPSKLTASVRRDLESVGRYYLERGEQDLAKNAFHISGLVLALEVCIGHTLPRRERTLMTDRTQDDRSRYIYCIDEKELNPEVVQFSEGESVMVEIDGCWVDGTVERIMRNGLIKISTDDKMDNYPSTKVREK